MPSFCDSMKNLTSYFCFSESFDKTVATFLIGMNMIQYLHLFKDADVGLNLFLTLTEDDLEVLGVVRKDHRKDIAHGIANIGKKKKKGDNPMRGLQDDVADSTLRYVGYLLHTFLCFKIQWKLSALILFAVYKKPFL